MNKKTRRFVSRMLAVVLSLATFILVDALLSGAMPIFGVLCLLPSAGAGAVYFFRLSVRPIAKRRARRLPQPPARMAPQGKSGVYVAGTSVRSGHRAA